MACGSCRASRSSRKQTFIWVSADGKESVEYSKEVVARAKVIKHGGSYSVKTA